MRGGPDWLGRMGPLPVGDFVGGKDMNGPNRGRTYGREGVLGA